MRITKLDDPVIIHFKEDSIPGVRRGVLIEESKQQIKDLMLELMKEAMDERVDNDLGAFVDNFTVKVEKL